MHRLPSLLSTFLYLAFGDILDGNDVDLPCHADHRALQRSRTVHDCLPLMKTVLFYTCVVLLPYMADCSHRFV